MSDPAPDLPSWFYGILIAAIGSLSAGLVKLFYMIRGDASDRDEAKACHEDRLEIWKALAQLNGGVVPGRPKSTGEA